MYYYFVRHAFGLIHSPRRNGGTKVRVYPDTMPLSRADVIKFKKYVARLSNRSEFKAAGVSFDEKDIMEVVSHDHDILQCLDVILGAMNFRLNDKHLDKPEGAKRRSKKTLARFKVYQQINNRIRQIYPHFNIGITTGHRGNKANRWHDPYRHWNFRARNSKQLPGGKRKKSETP